MAVYLILAVLPIFLGYCLPKMNENRQQKRIFYIICGLAMLLVMGCRHYSLGSEDTLHYYDAMKRALISKSWSAYYDPDYFEIGSQLFIFALSRVFKDPQWLLVITSLIYIVSLFYFVDRNSKDIALSITLYISLGLLMFELQGMRQSIAMSICLFAYEQAKKRRIIPFIIAVACAMTFHQTAIVFLIVYPLCGMRFSLKSIGLLSLASIIAFALMGRIIIFANDLFDRTYYDTVDGGGFVTVAIYVIIILFTFFADWELKEGNGQTPAFYLLVVGFVCYMMRYFGALAAERISFYFMFSQLVLLPNAKSIVVKNQREIMRLIIAVFAIILLTYRLLHGSEFFPYKFFWSV